MRPVGVYECVCSLHHSSILHTQMLTTRCQTPPQALTIRTRQVRHAAALKSLIIIIRLSSGIISIVNQMSRTRLCQSQQMTYVTLPAPFQAVEEDTCPHQVGLRHICIFSLIADG